MIVFKILCVLKFMIELLEIWKGFLHENLIMFYEFSMPQFMINQKQMWIMNIWWFLWSFKARNLWSNLWKIGFSNENLMISHKQLTVRVLNATLDLVASVLVGGLLGPCSVVF